MDTVDKVILYAETGIRRKIEDDTEPTEIYDQVDKLKKSNPYYFLQWWAATKEFQRAKLTRSNYLPQTATEDDKRIEIFVHENKNDSSISEDS